MKYKINKKVKEHTKRVKKEARKLKALGMVRKSKAIL